MDISFIVHHQIYRGPVTRFAHEIHSNSRSLLATNRFLRGENSRRRRDSEPGEFQLSQAYPVRSAFDPRCLTVRQPRLNSIRATPETNSTGADEP